MESSGNHWFSTGGVSLVYKWMRVADFPASHVGWPEDMLIERSLLSECNLAAWNRSVHQLRIIFASLFRTRQLYVVIENQKSTVFGLCRFLLGRWWFDHLDQIFVSCYPTRCGKVSLWQTRSRRAGICCYLMFVSSCTWCFTTTCTSQQRNTTSQIHYIPHFILLCYTYYYCTVPIKCQRNGCFVVEQDVPLFHKLLLSPQWLTLTRQTVHWSPFHHRHQGCQETWTVARRRCEDVDEMYAVL